MRFPGLLLFLSTLAWGQTCAPALPLRIGGSVSGVVSDGACRLSDGTAYAHYPLTLPTFGRLQLSAASDDFPVTLILRDSFGRKIDSGASIDRTIERGEFTVIVNVQSPGQSGKFTLSSTFQPEPNTLCRNFAGIGLNQLVAGQLADSSCRLPDNAAYDGFVLNTLGSGKLEISLESTDFDGQLILRDGLGRFLASGAKSISFGALADTTYNLVAAGANSDARGTYKLTTKFTPSDTETCRPQSALLTDADITGSVTIDSCIFATDLRYQYYDLTVAEAGVTELRITPGAEIASRLDILDASGSLIAEDIQSGGLNRPAIRVQLPPGSYTVLVTAGQAVDYTLQFRFTPGIPASCPTPDLRSGVQAGSFDASLSCRSLSAMQDAYRFTIGTANTVDIGIGSSVLSGYLILSDAKDNVLVQNTGEVFADLKAGTYSLRARSTAPGAYQINALFKGQNLTCPGLARVSVNNGYNGLLGQTNCRGADGQPLDVWEFSTSSAGEIGIIMQAQSVDSYIELTDTQGNVLRRDDNSFGEPDAMILQWLPGGTYRVNATASGGLQSGQYALYVLFNSGNRTPGCLPVGDLSPGTIQRTPDITSCEYLDGSFADIFRLPVPAATSLDITMTLARASIGLELLDSRGNLVDLVDNLGGGNSARLTTPVDAGTYYVISKAFALRSAYTLAVK